MKRELILSYEQNKTKQTLHHVGEQRDNWELF